MKVVPLGWFRCPGFFFFLVCPCVSADLSGVSDRATTFLSCRPPQVGSPLKCMNPPSLPPAQRGKSLFLLSHKCAFWSFISSRRVCRVPLQRCQSPLQKIAALTTLFRLFFFLNPKAVAAFQWSVARPSWHREGTFVGFGRVFAWTARRNKLCVGCREA